MSNLRSIVALSAAAATSLVFGCGTVLAAEAGAATKRRSQQIARYVADSNLQSLACSSTFYFPLSALPSAGEQGVSAGSIKRVARAAVRLRWAPAEYIQDKLKTFGGRPDMTGFERSGVPVCSGTLVGRNTVVTAAHCFAPEQLKPYGLPGIILSNGRRQELDAWQIAQLMWVDFNLNRDRVQVSSTETQFDVSLDDQQVVSWRVASLVDYSWDERGGKFDPKIDYAIARLHWKGDHLKRAALRRSEIGAASVPDRVTLGKKIVIVHHPEGQPKQVSVGRLYSDHTAPLLFHDAHTALSSSGAGLFDSDSRFLGVHNYGCADDAGKKRNRAVSVRHFKSQINAEFDRTGD